MATSTQKRVIFERDELKGKITALEDFLGRGKALVVPQVGERQYELLLKQRKLMKEYLVVLNLRLAAWGIEL